MGFFMPITSLPDSVTQWAWTLMQHIVETGNMEFLMLLVNKGAPTTNSNNVMKGYKVCNYLRI